MELKVEGLTDAAPGERSAEHINRERRSAVERRSGPLLAAAL